MALPVTEPRTAEPAADPLLPRVAAGDQGALQACLERFGPLVWSLARRLSGSTHDAEDAVQEIFLDLWRSAARFDGRLGSEWTFVATIARRRLIDRRRRSARRPGTELLSDQLGLAAAGPSLDEILLGGEEARLALGQLQQLQPEQKRCLELAIWDGLSHREIADHTGWPLGTVKTHLRRGLQRIREVLERRQ
jgi:RNA polymerase sigma-70 factor (ECF subfamily)